MTIWSYRRLLLGPPYRRARQATDRRRGTCRPRQTQRVVLGRIAPAAAGKAAAGGRQGLLRRRRRTAGMTIRVPPAVIAGYIQAVLRALEPASPPGRRLADWLRNDRSCLGTDVAAVTGSKGGGALVGPGVGAAP